MVDCRKISDLYEELVGIHQELFQKAVIKRAKRVLGKDLALAEKILEELVETISWLPPKKIPLFLEKVVCDDTFRFLKEEEIVQREKHKQINDFAFHINTKKLLDEANGKLMPRYILDGKPFNQKEYDHGDCEYYRTCFAKGSINDLSFFLAGHVFLGKISTLEEEAAEPVIRYLRIHPNSYYFPRTRKIAVVRTSDIVDANVEEHDIEVGYCSNCKEDLHHNRLFLDKFDVPDGVIAMIEAKFATPLVDTLEIPYLVWTQEQIESCKQEARRIRIEKGQDMETPLDVYLNIYVAERKFEQEISYALHNFITRAE